MTIFHLGERINRGPGRPKSVSGGGFLRLCQQCAKREARIHKMNPAAPYVTVSKVKHAVCAFCGRQLKQRIEEEPRTHYRQTSYEIWHSPQDHDPFVQEIKRRIADGIADDIVSDVVFDISDDARSECESRLSAVSERQRKTIEYRYGLCGQRPHTLKETGERFNVSLERVRQIIAKGMRRMRMEVDRCQNRWK